MHWLSIRNNAKENLITFSNTKENFVLESETNIKTVFQIPKPMKNSVLKHLLAEWN